jgi:hypothetical protein
MKKPLGILAGVIVGLASFGVPGALAAASPGLSKVTGTERAELARELPTSFGPDCLRILRANSDRDWIMVWELPSKSRCPGTKYADPSARIFGKVDGRWTVVVDFSRTRSCIAMVDKYGAPWSAYADMRTGLCGDELPKTWMRWALDTTDCDGTATAGQVVRHKEGFRDGQIDGAVTWSCDTGGQVTQHLTSYESDPYATGEPYEQSSIQLPLTEVTDLALRAGNAYVYGPTADSGGESIRVQYRLVDGALVRVER